MTAATGYQDTVKLKICLAGAEGVGKTSLIRRFVHDDFDDRYLTTMGAKVTKKELQVAMPGGKQRRVVLLIWDIMGEEGFRQLLREAYFDRAQGILAVCDVTRPESLADLEGWKNSIEKVAGRIPAFVLANKVDLGGKARVRRDVEARCGDWGCSYLFTSAKTGENVEKAFAGLTPLVLESQPGRVMA
jgi:small GTP-binding protein